MMDFLYQSIRDMLDWFFGKSPEASTTQSPPEVQEKQQQVHLDREAMDTIAREVARRIGELSTEKAQGARPVKNRDKEAIKIKTGYVPEIPDTGTDEEVIQTNLDEIEAKEGKSSDVDSSLKALKEINERK